MFPETKTYSEFTVGLRNYAIQEQISGQMLRSLSMEGWEDPVTGNLVRSLRSRVVCSQSEYLDFPEDWWQGLKLRWFPKWLERRFPVRWGHVEWWLVYPEAPEMVGPSKFHWQRVPMNPTLS